MVEHVLIKSLLKSPDSFEVYLRNKSPFAPAGYARNLRLDPLCWFLRHSAQLESMIDHEGIWLLYGNARSLAMSVDDYPYWLASFINEMDSMDGSVVKVEDCLRILSRIKEDNCIISVGGWVVQAGKE